jgi:predicted TPR repeat methyltransferase
MSRHSAFMRLDFALSFVDEGDFAAAIEAAEAAIEVLPQEAQFHFVLGEIFEKTAQVDKAIASFRRALELQDEDTLGAGVRLAVLGDASPLSRLPSSYVEALFDDYAPRFEKTLVQHLSYCAPEKVFDLLFSHASRLPKNPAILDLGCGTGLAGEYVRALAGRLDGIDLSKKMLKQAAKKRIYDELTQGDIEAEVSEDARRFDVVIACDVLNYLGDLSLLCQRVATRLRPGGFFAFSVESMERGQGQVSFELHEGQRFMHERTSIRVWLLAAGFEVMEERFTPIRTEKGHPVEGHLVFAKLRKFEAITTKNNPAQDMAQTEEALKH